MNDSDVRYRYFQRGAFPALFLLQVEEGMARFEVTDQENLDVLLAYCKQNGYQVEWSEAVKDEPEHVEELEGFPGGRYVAHLIPEEMLAKPAADRVPVSEGEPAAVRERA